MPEAAEPATRALRIDGFVRPFTERQVWSKGVFMVLGDLHGWTATTSALQAFLTCTCRLTPLVPPHRLLPCQVRDLLSETGQVLALWMPSIKTHAYCVFETKAQAEATRRVSTAAAA